MGLALGTAIGAGVDQTDSNGRTGVELTGLLIGIFLGGSSEKKAVRNGLTY